MLKKILLSLFALFLIVAVSIFRPVPIVRESKAIVVNGYITDIYEGGTNDIVFKIKDDNRRFYINRGLESGLTIGKLKEQLIGNKVTFKYPKYWTPLDWNNQIRHISKLEYNTQVLFSELR